ncbi:hypothetical protein EJ06DRAFT_362078 [Trichodelitschia bisporula]|uniref:Uncharacterized protein n=1 Tax=Trichodelitschia bisporula TaxID=703511 RepID=A0A6G1I0U6_9PEZI|nr:hypothetical protein EJ06DRAFT_362078 [Trichodelitschia bisporula]
MPLEENDIQEKCGWGQKRHSYYAVIAIVSSSPPFSLLCGRLKRSSSQNWRSSNRPAALSLCFSLLLISGRNPLCTTRSSSFSPTSKLSPGSPGSPIVHSTFKHPPRTNSPPYLSDTRQLFALQHPANLTQPTTQPTNPRPAQKERERDRQTGRQRESVHNPTGPLPSPGLPHSKGPDFHHPILLSPRLPPHRRHPPPPRGFAPPIHHPPSHIHLTLTLPFHSPYSKNAAHNIHPPRPPCYHPRPVLHPRHNSNHNLRARPLRLARLPRLLRSPNPRHRDPLLRRSRHRPLRRQRRRMLRMRRAVHRSGGASGGLE